MGGHSAETQPTQTQTHTHTHHRNVASPTAPPPLAPWKRLPHSPTASRVALSCCCRRRTTAAASDRGRPQPPRRCQLAACATAVAEFIVMAATISKEACGARRTRINSVVDSATHVNNITTPASGLAVRRRGDGRGEQRAAARTAQSATTKELQITPPRPIEPRRSSLQGSNWRQSWRRHDHHVDKKNCSSALCTGSDSLAGSDIRTVAHETPYALSW